MMDGATGAGRRHGIRGRAAVLAGVGSLLLAVGFGGSVAAQEPSPSGSDLRLLFFQVFQSGTWVPAAQGSGVTITLDGGSGQTAFATDWPDPTVGVVETQDILTAVAASVNSPPNAAIVSQLEDGSQVTFVVQILGAQEQSDGQLVYDAWLLDAGNTGGFDASPAPPPTAPITLGITHVFINGLAGACMRC